MSSRKTGNEAEGYGYAFGVMASKQVKKVQQQQQQRHKQPRAASKVVTPPSQERSSSSSDPWSFLELVEAPQWADLTLKGRSMEKDGLDDPWFVRSHKHHVKSLAGLNANMSWLRLGKLVQRSKSINPTRCQRGPSKPGKKQTADRQNKLGNKQSQYQGQGIGSRVHKEEQTFCNTERGCNAHWLSGSGKTGCSFSGCSSTCENEQSGSSKKRSLCSDRSSVSSSLQVCSIETKKSSPNAQRGSLGANLSEDFHDGPSCHSSVTQRSRNSSSASYCPPMARCSSEIGFSNCEKLSEFEVSRVAKLEFACEADRQSSGHSAATSNSVASITYEGQVDKGYARALEEGTICASKTSELKVIGDCNQPAKTDYSTCNKSLLRRQELANGALKSGIKAGRLLYTGKENAPPKENLGAAKLIQIEGGPSCTKAPLAFASSRTANARTVGLNLGGGFHASQASKVEGTQHALQMKPRKGGISQNLYSCRASSAVRQIKRSESNQLPVLYEKTSNSERELAALVAQHNQKVRSLQLQNCRKGLR